MRTLTLLAAILLLALQAQAEPLPGRADQAEEEEQDAVMTFSGEESSALQDAGGACAFSAEGCITFTKTTLSNISKRNTVRKDKMSKVKIKELHPKGLPAMRTLALLAAILLLALQAQAQPLPENAEEALEQQQPRQEDQDVAIPSAEAESSALQDAEQDLSALCVNQDLADLCVNHKLGLRSICPNHNLFLSAPCFYYPSPHALCHGQDLDPIENKPSSLEERSSKKPDLKLQK
ncbi:Defensin-7 [Fukomys damarensis]|uniref:Defensin-7 n=1 Tax=Fukomys damarensis TaxID=885580 RepID=A0A091DG78_FUKDA|nr:Defensin-7 [Fukomys damarensis]